VLFLWDGTYFKKGFLKHKYINYEIELLEMCCIAFCFNGIGRGNVIATQLGTKYV